MISEKSLEATIEGVRRVAPERRRIIVYTGVHPNEGTTQLALQNEYSWGKYGALVVAHPSDSTTHAIWERHKKLCEGKGFTPLKVSSEKLIETEFENAFADSETKFILRFHGSQSAVSRTSERYLGIFLPRTDDEDLLSFYMQLKTIFKTARGNPCHPDIYSQPQNRILIEYHYNGETVVVSDPFLRLVIEKGNSHAPGSKIGERPYQSQAFDTNDLLWDLRYNIPPTYLIQETPSPKDIEVFNSEHVLVFNKLLKQICDRIVSS